MFNSAWSLSFALAGTVVAVGILMMPFALLVIAGILRQRRSPASSLAWLLAILLLPLIGIPLFWLFGSRKIKRIAKAKPPVELTIVEPAAAAAPHPHAAQAAAHLGPASITRGNDLKFHDNGEAAFADFIALIDGAQQSIHIETYVLKADATGSAIIERLIARAQKGVEIRLLIDGFGSFHIAPAPAAPAQACWGQSGLFPADLAPHPAQSQQLARPSQDRCIRWRTRICRRPEYRRRIHGGATGSQALGGFLVRARRSSGGALPRDFQL